MGLWLVLGTWLGASGLFAFSVAPTAFTVLPSVEVAGSLVGPILTTLNVYGAAAGPVLAYFAYRLGRGGVATWLPLLLAALCLISELGITRAIGGVLPHDLGPDSDPNAAARFSSLHRASQLVFLGVLVGTAALVCIHSWLDEASEDAGDSAE